MKRSMMWLLFLVLLLSSCSKAPQIPENGVTIPLTTVDFSEIESADMANLFVYGGRVYVLFDSMDYDGRIIGDYLGTVRSTIDEWTPREDYQELNGNIGGDIYTIPGYDPKFILCQSYPDDEIGIFVCDEGITFKTGADLLGDRLHLSGQEKIVLQPYEDWYHSTEQFYRFKEDYQQQTADFMALLQDAPAIEFSQIPRREKSIWHLYCATAEGIEVHFRLYEGGYVTVDGVNLGFWVEEKAFNRFLKLASNPEARELIQMQKTVETEEECRKEQPLGTYIPAYVPEGTVLSHAEIRYYFNRGSGELEEVRQLKLEYAGKVFYTVEIGWVYDYESYSNLPPVFIGPFSPEAIEAQWSETDGGLSLHQYDNDFWIAIKGKNLDPQIVYEILTSIA